MSVGNPYQKEPRFEPVFPTKYKVLAVLLVLGIGVLLAGRSAWRNFALDSTGEAQRLESELAAARAENEVLRAQVEALVAAAPTPDPGAPATAAPDPRSCAEVTPEDLQETIQRIAIGSATKQLDDAEREALLAQLQREADCLGVTLPPMDTFRNL